MHTENLKYGFKNSSLDWRIVILSRVSDLFCWGWRDSIPAAWRRREIWNSQYYRVNCVLTKSLGWNPTPPPQNMTQFEDSVFTDVIKLRWYHLDRPNPVLLVFIEKGKFEDGAAYRKDVMWISRRRSGRASTSQGTHTSEIAHLCPTLRHPWYTANRLLHTWDFPSKSTGRGCRFLHQDLPTRDQTWVSPGQGRCPLSHQESPDHIRLLADHQKLERGMEQVCIKNNRRTYSICALVLDLQPPEWEMVHFFVQATKFAVFCYNSSQPFSIQNVLHNFSVKPLLSLNHILIFSGNWALPISCVFEDVMAQIEFANFSSVDCVFIGLIISYNLSLYFILSACKICTYHLLPNYWRI